jgi:hypothetical protein
MIFFYTHFDRATFRRSVIKFDKASSNKGMTNNYDYYNISRTQFALGV